MQNLAFLDDIKSKHLGTYALVTIGNPDNPIYRISTQKVTLGEDYYKHILLGIPSLSESLGVENRKYKISSVRLSISDYEEDGVRFSDSLNALMNKEVNIYYATQSSKSLTYWGDDLGTTEENADVYHAGTFIIRSFTQDEDKVGLNCEDLSQDKLHKDLPLKSIADDISLKDKNKSIPILFGEVNRSPLVYDGDKFIIDDTFIPSVNDIVKFLGHNHWDLGFLSVYTNDEYIDLLKTDTDDYITQYENIDNEIYITDDSQIALNIGKGIVLRPILKARNLYIGESSNNEGEYSINFGNSITGEDSHFDNSLWSNDSGSPPFNTITGTAIDHPAVYKYTHLMVEPSKSDYPCDTYFVLKVVNDGQSAWVLGLIDPKDILVEIDSDLPITPTLNNWDGEGSTRDMYPVLEWNTLNAKEFLYFGIPPMAQSGVISGNEYLNIDIEAREIWLYHIFSVDSVMSNDFFANATGRGGSGCQVSDVYHEILNNELTENEFGGQTNPVNNPIEGQYAFTLDRKINSKKLLEEISASSGLFPYFKDGKFNVKSIKTKYDSSTNTIIKAEDVLTYKYDRTKIEKVYTQVKVVYNYDYGLKDFTKETDFITPDEFLIGDGGATWNSSYFGEDFDQELVFESKYIRDGDTARNLAKYLCGLHANQHNLITVKLPLNYLNLELGNIVKFDKLIQGRKIFGEDYTIQNYDRNAQNIYNLFFITQIKKNLDSVEVKLYQLHEFDFEADVTDPVIYGCTDPTATNYNPNATLDDDSCEYQNNIVEGCSDSDALNYNPEADEDDGTCVLQTDMQPPSITAPDDGFVLESTLEPVEGGGDGELVLSDNIALPENSTFDGNVEGEGGDIAIGTNGYEAIGTAASGYTNGLFDEDLYYKFGNFDLIGYTLTNTTTGQSAEITNNENAGGLQAMVVSAVGVSFENGDGWQITTPFVEGVLMPNVYTTSPLSGTSLRAGNGTLIFTNTNQPLQNTWLNFKPKDQNLPEDMDIVAGDEFRFEFSIRRIVGNSPSFKLRVGNEWLPLVPDSSDDIHSMPFDGNNWMEISIDHTFISNKPNAAFAVWAAYDPDNLLFEMEFDNLFIHRITGGVENSIDVWVAPSLTVHWDKSSSLVESIPALGNLITSGYYKVFIRELVEGAAPEVLSGVFAHRVDRERINVGTNISTVYDKTELVGREVVWEGGSFNITDIRYVIAPNESIAHLRLYAASLSEIININTNLGITFTIMLDEGSGTVEETVYGSDIIGEDSALESFSHLINFGDHAIPQNTGLLLKVFAYCEDQYNEEYIFTVKEGGIPSANDSIGIEWSSGNDGIETSSMVNNNDLANTTIERVVEAIDDPDADVGELIGNITGGK